MSEKSYDYGDLLWANAEDAGANANIDAIAAPSAGWRIVVKRYKVNVQGADTVQIGSWASGSSTFTEKDRHYLSAMGGYESDFGECPMELPAATALRFKKTLATTMNYHLQYAVVRV